MRIFVLLLVLWAILSEAVSLNQYFMPDFTGVIRALYEETASGAIFANLITTLGRVGSGLFVALLLGVVIGVFLGINRKARELMMPLLEFLRGIPTSMLFPVFIVSLGVGELSKTAIVATATFPILVISFVVGFAPRSETQDRRDFLSIHQKYIPRKTHVAALVWDAIPSILGGTKVAISIALVLTIVTEMFFVASSGVGWAAYQAYQSFDLNLMYGYILVVGCIGVGVNSVFDSGMRLISTKIGVS